MTSMCGTYDVRPVIQYLERQEHSLDEIAETLEISYRQVMRHINEGQKVHQWQADRLAIRAGLHPAEVWDQWW